MKLDRDQWRTFLKILGKDPKQVRLRSFFPSNHPLKTSDTGKKSSASGDWIKTCQEEGRGVYLVVNDGGDTDSSITDCRAFFVEWDDRPKEDQITAWQDLELPEPTIQVDTGGKSIHNYWVLSKVIDATTWRSIQERLLEYADADRSLKNPSRVMRLPGTFHMTSDGSPGEMCEIIHQSDKTYLSKEIEKVLPTKKMHSMNMESRRFTNYEKHDLETVKKALDRIPARKAGTGTYEKYRNVLWGLVKACEEAGYDKEQAMTLMKSHSPELDVKQVANSGGRDISAGTFWYWAKHYGFKAPARNAIIPSFKDPESQTTVITGEKLPRIEPDQLLRELRALKGSDQEFRYNVFTQQIERGADVCEGRYSIERFYLELACQNKVKCSKDVATDCVIQVARENEYDPVRSYLVSIEETVSPTYIDRLASTYLRPQDAALSEPTLYDHMLKATLIGAVKRVFQPGCKHDNACVLMGKQGAKKSTFWSVLGGPFFSDSLKDTSSKDDLMVLHSSWIMEMQELDQITSKRQAGEVKSFLSQSTDMFRVPYGKATERFPRRGIIVGTTNRETGFLFDETGNRRFWIIRTTCDETNQINDADLYKERDSIWAGAVSAYRNREPNSLPKEFEQMIEEENIAYLVENPWKPVIEEYVNDPKNRLVELTADLILTNAIEKPIERQTRYDQMQVSQILRDLGFEKTRKRTPGSRKWVYVRDSRLA